MEITHLTARKTPYLPMNQQNYTQADIIKTQAGGLRLPIVRNPQ